MRRKQMSTVYEVPALPAQTDSRDIAIHAELKRTNTHLVELGVTLADLSSNLACAVGHMRKHAITDKAIMGAIQAQAQASLDEVCANLKPLADIIEALLLPALQRVRMPWYSRLWGKLSRGR